MTTRLAGRKGRRLLIPEDDGDDEADVDNGVKGPVETGQQKLFPLFKKPAPRARGASGKKEADNGRKGASGMGELPLSQAMPISRSPGQELPVGNAVAAGNAADGSEAARRGGAEEVHISSPSEQGGQLWVDKYAPRLESDLAVNKKKVEEVKGWLQWQLQRLGQRGPSKVMVLKGPTGVGKTAVVKTLASALGFEVREWQTPVPLLWEEAAHAQSSGLSYTSKLEEFELFLRQACIFPSLSLSTVPSSHLPSPPPAPPQSPAPLPTTSPSSRPPPHHAPQHQKHLHHQQQQQQQQQLQSSVPEVQMTADAGSQPPLLPRKLDLLLVDDLPHVGDPGRRARLGAALERLAGAAQFPVVVILTASAGVGGDEGSGARGGAADASVDACAALRRGGAGEVSFNPITAQSMTKVLTRVATAEGLRLSPPTLSALATSSNGDIRHALLLLQFMCQGGNQPGGGASQQRAGTARQGVMGHAEGTLPWDPGGGGSAKAGKRRRGLPSSAEGMAPPVGKVAGKGSKGGKAGRGSALSLPDGNAWGGGWLEAKGPGLPGSMKSDEVLSLFHALGKFLHNKRHEDQAEDGQDLPAELRRRPLHMEAPELVLAKARTDIATVTSFLHENYIDFVDEDAIDDAAETLNYISDADVLLAGGPARSGRWRGLLVDDAEPDPSRVAVEAAGSVAARGLLFASRHPAPRIWRSVRAPQLFRLHGERLRQLAEIKAVSRGGAGSAGLAQASAADTVLFTETWPFRCRMRALASWQSSGRGPALGAAQLPTTRGQWGKHPEGPGHITAHSVGATGLSQQEPSGDCEAEEGERAAEDMEDSPLGSPSELGHGNKDVNARSTLYDDASTQRAGDTVPVVISFRNEEMKDIDEIEDC